MTREAEATSILDDASLRARLDPTDVLTRIDQLPEQIEEGWAAARSFAWPEGAANARQVLVLGMGGSAIAGDILRSTALLTGDKPVDVVRGYDVPAYVDADTFVVACSHSGNTEETVSAIERSLEHGAKAAVITTGGRLAEIAAERSLSAFVYSYDAPPRCATGHQLTALLALGEHTGLLKQQGDAVEAAVAAMRAQRQSIAFDRPVSDNAAKQLALRLQRHVPVIVGSGPLAIAAHRWKTQVNENSKSWAFWDELPEMDHNSVVGFGLPRTLVEQLHVLFLLSTRIDRRDEVRYEATADELSRAGVTHERIDISGGEPLAQVLSAVYLGDFVSFYLAMLNGVDPAPIDQITRIKNRLAKG